MYVEASSDIRIETVVGNILGSLNVPPPGMFNKDNKKNVFLGANE
jgi:hypothetical protein